MTHNPLSLIEKRSVHYNGDQQKIKGSGRPLCLIYCVFDSHSYIQTWAPGLQGPHGQSIPKIEVPTMSHNGLQQDN